MASLKIVLSPFSSGRSPVRYLNAQSASAHTGEANKMSTVRS